jgi:multiple sugar transport system permease protein
MTGRSAFIHRKFYYRNEKWAYLMLLPGFVAMTIFVVVPIIIAVYRSFFEYNAYSTTQTFVGFHNYELLFTDDLFLKSMGNVCIFTLIITVVTIILSFFFALLLRDLRNKLAGLAKVIIYIPFLLSGIIAGIMFIFQIAYSGGLFNALLTEQGHDPIAFATEGIWPYLLIIIPTVWLSFGYNALVFYSGLMNIPQIYYEAADIDGASWLAKTVKITIPNLKNYFLIIVVGLITSNLQMFEIPFMMTGGGPLYKTLTPVLFLYNLYRDPNANSSETIAGALVLMIPIALINALVFKVVSSEKSQDA